MGHTALSVETLAINHKVKYIIDDHAHSLMGSNVNNVALSKFAILTRQSAYHRDIAKISRNWLYLLHKALRENIDISTIAQLISAEHNLMDIGIQEQKTAMISHNYTFNNTITKHLFFAHNTRQLAVSIADRIEAQNGFEYDEIHSN